MIVIQAIAQDCNGRRSQSVTTHIHTQYNDALTSYYIKTETE